ncbi:MAG: hypothetical protein KJZ80_13410 [Hyphomicrobiaceae bacterium]|nr:hypothetical protein [Hyphomicrobiaceae bacterium]
MSTESWTVGEHHVLFSTSTRAVAVANRTAAMVWKLCVQAVAGTAAVRELAALWRMEVASAERVIDGLLDTWRSAGLIPAGDAAPAAGTEAFPPLRAGVEASYRSDAGCFKITSEDPAFAAVMEAVLAPLAAGPAPVDRTCRIDVRGIAETYTVVRDGEAVYGPGNVALARHAVLSNLLTGHPGQRRISAVLHASAVSLGGRALVVAGDCGSGKSTLTAGLVHQGAGYIGDDLIPLSRDGSRIGAFPVALSVKQGARETLRPLYPERLWSGPVSINGHVLHYIDLTHCAGVAQTFPVAAILFPKFRTGATTEIERLTPEAALQHLLASGSRTVGADPTIEGLCRLVNSTPAYRLAHGGWRAASEVIASVVQSPSDSYDA